MSDEETKWKLDQLNSDKSNDIEKLVEAKDAVIYCQKVPKR